MICIFMYVCQVYQYDDLYEIFKVLPTLKNKKLNFKDVSITKNESRPEHFEQNCYSRTENGI